VRVVVAMSGGVDSSVVAGLLHEAGHEVIGVTLQLYDHGQAAGRKGACCAGQDIHDARNVADRLGIAHYVIDSEQAFRRNVIQAFADSYAAGQTPVPCVACNQHLKFGDLLGLARELGAEALATGHYVRRESGAEGAELHRAVDDARDQSWFLFATTRAQLEFARFPLGEMPSKAAVRAEAARMGLPVADKADSQDICFVPAGSYADIVARLRPDAAEPGDIVNAQGQVLDRHQGIGRYTVGQAKRLGAASGQVVTRIDAPNRRIEVGPRHTGGQRILLRDCNWLIAPPDQPMRAMVKLRARETPHPALIDFAAGSVTLEQPALAAPGQACVVYDGTRVLGGGFIQ